MAVEHDYLKRTATSDSSLDNGRFATLGSEEPSGVMVSVDMDLEQETSAVTYRGGVLARYVNTSNCLMLVKTTAIGYLISEANGVTYWSLIKRLAGVSYFLAAGQFGQGALGPRLYVGRDGICRVFADADLSTPTEVTNPDPDLVFGGTLGKGKYGIYDAYTSASALERKYRRFAVITESIDPVLFADLTARLTHQGHLRRSSDDASWGPVHRPGADLPRIPVSGPEELPVEIGLKPSRGDFATLPDAGLDAIKGTPSYRPCYSSIPEE